MRAYVRLRGPNSAEWLLGPGDVIGRLPSAALPIDSARISEVHALISLRAGALRLLGLRSMVAVDGALVPDVELVAGLRIELAPGVALTVVAVELPSELLALQGAALPRQVLTTTCCLVSAPQLALVNGYDEQALAQFWPAGADWRARVGREAAITLQVGQQLQVAGHAIEVVAVAVQDAGAPRTAVQGALSPALRIVASYETVQIYRQQADGRDGDVPVVIQGIPAQIVSELVAQPGPVSWELIAAQIWRSEEDRARLRRRWDVGLTRVREKLREAGIRPDLLRSHGRGEVELVLLPGDVIDDRT